MDNSARTSLFLAERETRRATLQRDLTGLVPFDCRLTLEIGSGHGHFLTAYAAAHPKEFCIGIDLVAERVRRSLRKRDRANLTNLSFLQAEAEEFVAALPSHASLHRILVLFPDPWPKRRHHKNRIMQPSFLSALAARASAGAGLYFRTDYNPYFSAAEAVVKTHPDWQLTDAPWAFERETVFQSRADTFQSLVAERRPAPENLERKRAAPTTVLSNQPLPEKEANLLPSISGIHFQRLTPPAALPSSDSFLNAPRRSDRPCSE